MALSDNFTVTASECRSDGEHHKCSRKVGLMKTTKKLGENEDWEACESTLQISHIFSPIED